MQCKVYAHHLCETSDTFPYFSSCACIRTYALVFWEYLSHSPSTTGREWSHELGKIDWSDYSGSCLMHKKIYFTVVDLLQVKGGGFLKSLQKIVAWRLVAQLLDLDGNCRFLAIWNAWDIEIERIWKRSQVRYSYEFVLKVWLFWRERFQEL